MIRVQVGEYDVTSDVEDLTTSNVDPGGLETCSFSVPDVAREVIREGDDVRIFSNKDWHWHGRVEEPGDKARAGRAAQSISAVGYGAALKDTEHQQLYLSQELGEWGTASNSLQLAYLNSSRAPHGGVEVQPDKVTGEPTLTQKLIGTWPVTDRPVSLAVFDAGDGCLIGGVLGRWVNGPKVSLADTNWNLFINLAALDDFLVNQASADLAASAAGLVSLTANGAYRYALLQFGYDIANAAADNAEYTVDWTDLTVYGTSALTIRDGLPGGFWPSDIVRYALGKDLDDKMELVIVDTEHFVVPHLHYRDPVALEAVVEQMAGLVGWHWGVWEPATVFGRTPRFLFQPPPALPQAFVAVDDVVASDLVSRYSDFHNEAKVSYTDVAGVRGYATVQRDNPRMPEGKRRVLSLDFGIGSAEAAAAFGRIALELEEQQARAAGSVELPSDVLIDGHSRPPHQLRSGLHRLQIGNLPNSGPVTALDRRRYDSFRIKRQSTTWSGGGTPTTKVELDAGANLLEVVQARLQFAARVIGGG